MAYNSMRKKLKGLLTHEKLEDGSFTEVVNYNATYSINSSKATLIRSSMESGLLLILFVIMTIFFLRELVDYTSESRMKSLFFLVFSAFMVIVIFYSFYSSTKSYPKLKFYYLKGIVRYNDGIRLHEFQVKSITSISLFYPFNRSSKWQLRISIWGNQKPVVIDILKFEEPETIFRLLTNFNDKINLDLF